MMGRVVIVMKNINTGQVIKRRSIAVYSTMSITVSAPGYSPAQITVDPNQREIEVNLVPRYGALR